MGWRFRRSTKIGPFRITSSKSGTSFSFGGKGYRVTRQANGKIRKTYSIPGTGISYSETSPSKKQRKQQKQLRTLPTYRNSRDKYNFDYEQSAAPRPHKHTARWVFSVLFLLIGITHLASAPISGILFLVAAFVLNPVIAPNINLHGALPTVLAFLLVIAGTIAFPSDPAHEAKASTRAGAEEAKIETPVYLEKISWAALDNYKCAVERDDYDGDVIAAGTFTATPTATNTLGKKDVPIVWDIYVSDKNYSSTSELSEDELVAVVGGWDDTAGEFTVEAGQYLYIEYNDMKGNPVGILEIERKP